MEFPRLNVEPSNMIAPAGTTLTDDQANVIGELTIEYHEPHVARHG